MRVDDVIIGVLVCAFFLVAGVMIFDEQIDAYDINVTNRAFENAGEYISEINESVANMKDAMKPSGIGIVDALNFLIAAAGNALTIAWTTILLPPKMIFEFISVFGLHPIVGVVLTSIIMVSIVFGLIYLYFRFKPPRD